ncbi:MAG: choice-of-anchor D domain-containing protein [Myxococcota bacterium]
MLSTSSQDFGSVATGTSTTAVIGVSNTGEVATGAPSFSTGGEFSVPSNTCGASIAPGGNCSVTVRFSPSAVGNRSGVLTASANPGGMASASLTGIGVTPGTLAISPTSRDFGSVQVGQTGGFEVFNITNTGGVTLSGLNVTVGGGSASSFVKSNDTCTGSSLPPASGCVVLITFTPQASGALSAYVQASEAGGTSVQAPLSGTGLRPASLSISPISQSWPDTVVGTSGITQTFTVTNDGDVTSGTLSSTILGADASHFGFVSGANTCTGTLAGQASCTIRITFTPTSGGVKQASLAVDAMPGGSATASLTGRGLTPAALTLAPAAGSSTNYGNVLLGTNVSMSFTVTNTGQQASGPLSLSLTGPDAAMFQVVGGTGSCQLGQPLAGGASCTSSVRFTAGSGSTRGTKSATLTASASPGSAPSLGLTANVQFPAQLTAASSWDFGGVEVGQPSAAYTWTIQNTGDVPTGTLTFMNTNSTDFGVTSNTCTGSLGAGSNCTVHVRLTPSAGGNRSGTLTLSATPGGSVALAMTGRGQWRLSIVASGSSVGTVSTTDGRLSCGSSPCSALYDDGSAVTIRATTANGSGFHFAYWANAPMASFCTRPGHGYQCTVAMSAHVSANARFMPIAENLIFVSSSVFPATLGSAAAYDAQCNTLASAAGINSAAGNAYVAWISTDASPVIAPTRLGTGKGAFRRMDDALFATSESDLLAGKVLNAPVLDEYGQTRKDPVWTGTRADGTSNGSNDCSDWTSSAGVAGYGVSYGGPGRWSVSSGALPCAGSARIYCLMKTSTTTASNPSVPMDGKVAYITKGVFEPSSSGNGLSSLDNFCNSNKPVGFLTRFFVAFAASTTGSAGARLTQTASYYRPDGQLVGTGAEIASGIVRSGIWQGQDLSYPGGDVLVWTGASAPNALGTSDSTCADWTSSGLSGLGGLANTVDSEFFGAPPASCTTGMRLYCVEP